MKILGLGLVLVSVMSFGSSSADSWTGFYDPQTLDTWGRRVIPGIRTTLQSDLLPRVPPETRRSLQGVALSFPMEDEFNLLAFQTRSPKSIELTVSSLRFLRDLCVAYAWIGRNGYTPETISDYLTMIRVQGPPGVGRGDLTPLNALGVPANAMDDSWVNTTATALFGTAVTFILGHELGHIAYGHPGYDDISRDRARANETQADEFGLELMKQLAQPPGGVVIFLTALAHLELDRLQSTPARRNRTHPVNSERIAHVGRWIRANAAGFARSSTTPVETRAAIDRMGSDFSEMASALDREGVNVLLRLRGLTATVEGLKPRYPNDPLIPYTPGKAKLGRPWDGVFHGWWTAGEDSIATEMQLISTPQGVRGHCSFGAGRVRIEGETEKNRLSYTWSIDAANRGDGTLVAVANGEKLTGTWKRANDGFEATWNLHRVGNATRSLPAEAAAANPPRRSAANPKAGLGSAQLDGESKPKKGPNIFTIGMALVALDLADTYHGFADVFVKYESALASERAFNTTEARLQDASLDEIQRGRLYLMRQACLDCRENGGAVALRRFSARMLAGHALIAQTAEEYAEILDKFAEFAPELTADLLRESLSETPGIEWPPQLLPMMIQLSADWPRLGGAVAAQRMAAAAQPAPEVGAGRQSVAAGLDARLVGHWRTTSNSLGSTRDQHLVLQADGSATRWSLSVSEFGESREAPQGGRWRSHGGTIEITWDDDTQSSPFTIHTDGNLVWPNLEGRRRFWERVQ